MIGKRRNLLTEIRTALKDPRIIVLDERVLTHSVSASGLDKYAKGLQSVNITLAPAKGIYHLDTNQYWTETGKNLSGWDYFWGHWKCPEVDNLNQLLEEVFSSVHKGTSEQPTPTSWEGEREMGMKFEFELGELKPTEADRVEKAAKVEDWFKQNKPTEFYFPTITTYEVIGVGEHKEQFSYRLFPEFYSDVKEEQRKGIEKCCSENKLDRKITIKCYPCKEFYIERAGILHRRRQILEELVNMRSTGKKPTKEDYENSRKRESGIDKELEGIGCHVSDLRIGTIHLAPYNEYFGRLISK